MFEGSDNDRQPSYGHVNVDGNANVVVGNVYQAGPTAELTKEQRCHQVFKTSRYESHKDRNPSRVAGTCEWALDHQQFRNWRLSTHDALLWISADPGCGKSVLSKALVDEHLCGGEQTTTCYFFFKDNEEQDDLATALCALLHQLFSQQPHLLRHAIPAWEKNGAQLQRETKEMWRILRASAGDREAAPIVCVLDALDECKDLDRRQLIGLLCDVERSAHHGSSTGILRVLVTSRPYDNVQRWFEQTTSKWPHIRLRGEDQNDRIHQEINLVIDRRIGDLAGEFGLNPIDSERLRQQLLQMQHRTYLWLQLAIEEVRELCRDCIYADEMHIESLPSSVEDAYERMLCKINATQKAMARRILLIIVGARRPLTVAEMALALGAARADEYNQSAMSCIEPTSLERKIRDQCGLFVFVNHSQLFLIHQTAKEFLVARCSNEVIPGLWKSCLWEHQIEREMTSICVTYLYLRCKELVCSKDDHQGRQEVRASNTHMLPQASEMEDGFFRYCCEHWVSHLKDDSVQQNSGLFRRVLSLYMTDDLFHQWFPVMWRTNYPYNKVPHVHPQHALSITGHAFALESVLCSNSMALEERDSTNRTALHWAAKNGHEKVAQILLEHGADVNAEGSYGSALRAASERGHEKMVQILLDHGADTNAEEGMDGSALYAASAGGHEKVLQMLLENGADVNAKGGYYGNALYAASIEGHEKVVQMLLEHGANANAEGKYGDSALEVSSARGREKVVQILLEYGAANTGDRCGSSLYTASQGGHEKVVQMLLEHGADANARGSYGSALQAASIGGHEKVVQILLEHDAEVSDARGKFGGALQAASTRGHEKVVQMLLERGADANAGECCGSALRAASERGHGKVVQILLAHGADSNSKGASDGSALQAASVGGHEKVVQILLEHGADAHAGGKDGSTLQAASEGGHEKVVQMLLEHGADANAGGKHGSALQAASAGGHEKVVQTLLEHGADVNGQGGKHGSALRAALTEGHEKVVQILLEHGADVNATGGYYGNALQAASAGGHEKMVQMLLGHGTDVNAGKGEYGSALQAASAGGHDKVVQMLLEHGADVNARKGFYGSALQAASAGGHGKVVQMLLEHGANVNATKGQYGSALQAASAGGHEKVVMMLLEHGANVNATKGQYGSALQAALARGHGKVVQMLWEHGTKINAEGGGLR